MTRPRRWREVERRPVPGSSPDDRVRHGPDCYRPKRACADPFPATPWPRLPKIQRASGMRFRRHAESIGPIEFQTQNQNQRPGGGVPPPVGRPPGPSKERDGRSALCSSSAMSSDRLFLDRVARQHCPSPLHRHAHTTMHPRPERSEPDISTLQGIGHLYFALTGVPSISNCTGDVLFHSDFEFGSQAHGSVHAVESVMTSGLRTSTSARFGPHFANPCELSCVSARSPVCRGTGYLLRWPFSRLQSTGQPVDRVSSSGDLPPPRGNPGRHGSSSRSVKISVCDSWPYSYHFDS